MIAALVAALLSAMPCISLAFAPRAHGQVSTVDVLTDFHLTLPPAPDQTALGPHRGC
jgi:hypothetical protein